MARVFDGAKTTISVGTIATLFPTGITPPTFEGGGEIDTTTLKNQSVRTRQPKIVKDLGECSFSAQYDPAAIATLYGVIQTNQSIIITFADTSTITFWGFVDSVSVGEITEGEAPTLDVTIIASNSDNTDPPAEQVPVFA